MEMQYLFCKSILTTAVKTALLYTIDCPGYRMHLRKSSLRMLLDLARMRKPPTLQQRLLIDIPCCFYVLLQPILNKHLADIPGFIFMISWDPCCSQHFFVCMDRIFHFINETIPSYIFIRLNHNCVSE